MARRVSLSLVLRTLPHLDYIARRQLFCFVARSIIEANDAPRNDDRPGRPRPSPDDIAVCLVSDVRAILGQSYSPSSSTAALCAESAGAERDGSDRLAGNPHGPRRRDIG